MDFAKELENDVVSEKVIPSALLSKFRFIEESSKKTPAYLDPRYIPFYYHLGKYINPINMVEFGFKLGLNSGCFLKRCETVKKFLAFQEVKADYYPKISVKNIRDIYKNDFHLHVGDILDESFCKLFEGEEWDLVLINEDLSYDKQLMYMDFSWKNVRIGGLMAVDFVGEKETNKKAFFNFCKTKNRSPDLFSTRYGVGIIQK